jgi:uncharacterized membrane protein YkoI
MRYIARTQVWLLLVSAFLFAVSLAGVSAIADENEKGENETNEVKVTMDQLPAPVKTTVEKEAQGGQIGELEKATQNGKTIYEADLTVGGKKSEIHVSEDGMVLSREAGHEEGEEHEKD